MFTRRHYIAIAKVLQQHFAEQNKRIAKGWDPLPLFDGDMIRDELAVMFKADNPRFDHARFIKACWPVE